METSVHKIAILGAAGRMGQSNILTAYQDKNVQIVGATEYSQHPLQGKDAGVLAGCGEINVAITDDLNTILQKADVLIDFTSPPSTLSALEKNLQYKKAFIIGTTGLSDPEKDQIKNYSKEFPIVFAPNFSIGVNVLLKVTELAASLLNKDKDYDLEIIEAHHRFKKDAPSGTALKLAEVAAKSSGRDLKKDAVYGREGITGERTIDEIGMLTMRAGDIIGDHKVIFATLGERVELSHIAHSRATFSKGALLAAKWLKGKSTGLYNMADVLGF
ncbi:MAG TPA: 4-hydroxy-tetrahydrodipicolinate reductase [Spirochaetes bacterium]|nr:4-hydroxy-tetrahydrodipicolinate reductase [Spirochaetota bacterium]